MTPIWRNGNRGRHSEEGLTLAETLVSILILTVILGGLIPLLVRMIQSTDRNQRQVELLNVARAKLEEIQSVPYDQVGIKPDGEGYFESDPLYNPTYSAVSDFLLSDTAPLSSGVLATRTVTVEAIDDPTDLTGANDWDQVIDPNTGTILDYKLVRVVVQATDSTSSAQLTQEVSTIVRGLLDDEIDGAEAPPPEKPPKPPKKGKKKKSDKKKKGEKGADHGDPPEGKGKKGRKSKSKETDD